MPRPPNARSGKVAPVLVLLLILVLPVAAILGTLYVVSIKRPLEQNAAENRERLMQVVGLRDPVKNRLDARFADADGDLVADVPADPKQLADPPTLVFCYVAVAEPDAYREAWRPFTEHLSKVTGKPVEYAMLTSAKEQLAALAGGRLHVTGFNTGAVPTAVNRCGFVPVVKLPTDDGSGMSRMRLIVPADSDVRSVADLRGHELALTDPGSNSGFKAPLVLLRSDFVLLPGRDYQVRYSGGHDRSIEGIAKRQYQAAAVADDMLARALAAGQIQSGQYRSVYESEKFPTAGLGYAHNLKPELAAKVREALETFDWRGTPLEQRLGGASAGGTKFVPANYKNDWALIRRIDDESGAEPVPAAAAAPATAPASATAPAAPPPATRPAGG
jgi:phosphonate transport system substrate-binding protein